MSVLLGCKSIILPKQQRGQTTHLRLLNAEERALGEVTVRGDSVCDVVSDRRLASGDLYAVSEADPELMS